MCLHREESREDPMTEEVLRGPEDRLHSGIMVTAV